jgi:SAM-dependent MidA family methyltransferase
MADRPGASGAVSGGPERLDHFMARANAIYYASHDPFADFTTAPEISQMFGEIVGLWAAIGWQLLGSPASVALVEAGPGRGTLMADALRAIRQAVPAFATALQVHFIETSPRLRTAQASRVPEATWHENLASVPEQPMIFLANEFLDALPIRQFVRRGDGWAEKFVDGRDWLELPVGPADVPPGRAAGDGDIVELNEASRAFVEAVALRLTRHRGLAWFADYGPARSAAGDTLQALANKRPIDPLTTAGSADLTAHVDFQDLAAVARAAGAAIQGPVTQGAFLSALGLFERSERLARARPDRAAAVIRDAHRLASPAEMGDLFKVMVLRSPGVAAMPGLG